MHDAAAAGELEVFYDVGCVVDCDRVHHVGIAHVRCGDRHLKLEIALAAQLGEVGRPAGVVGHEAVGASSSFENEVGGDRESEREIGFGAELEVS